MARDAQPQFNASGMAYELSIRDFSGADERQPVLEDNEAHAPGKMCERCGQAIAAGQDARCADGGWAREACPMEW